MSLFDNDKDNNNYYVLFMVESYLGDV